MQVILLVTVIVFYKQWEENLKLHIRNRYLVMLKSRSASNRLTFMARVMSLASKFVYRGPLLPCSSSIALCVRDSTAWEAGGTLGHV